MDKKKSIWRNVNARTVVLITISVLAATVIMMFAVFPFYSADMDMAKSGETTGVIVKYTVISCVVLTGLLAIISNVVFRYFIQPLYRKLAYNDYLTLAKNRNSFELDMEALEFEKDAINAASVVVFEIHNIKEINATLGSSAGDALIADIATMIMSVFDQAGNTYRIGGYEFACIALETSPAKVEKLLEEFSDRFRRYKANRLDTLSVSWGHDEYVPSDGRPLREVYNKANARMHASVHTRNKQ